MNNIKPIVVDVEKVMPLSFGESYDSRMILDHVITGRDNVIQMNHGTVKAGCALGGETHDEDEIYYMLTGHGKLKLGEEVIDVKPNQVIFIPKGCFHALDNSESTEDMTLLTFWRDYRYNGAYAERIKQWGTSFRTIDE